MELRHVSFQDMLYFIIIFSRKSHVYILIRYGLLVIPVHYAPTISINKTLVTLYSHVGTGITFSSGSGNDLWHDETSPECQTSDWPMKLCSLLALVHISEKNPSNISEETHRLIQ